MRAAENADLRVLKTAASRKEKDMEFLRGSLFSITPSLIRVEGRELAILASRDSGGQGYYVDLGYRRRFWTFGTLYLVHREADETVRWESIDAEGNLEEDKNGKKVFKLVSWLKAKGYHPCTCVRSCSLDEYRNGCGYVENIILMKNGGITKEYGWFDYDAYRWSVDFYRPGLLSVDGRAVREIFTDYWITRNLTGKQEDAFLKLFESSAAFTNVEFVRWLADLGMGESLDWIYMRFFDDPSSDFPVKKLTIDGIAD